MRPHTHAHRHTQTHRHARSTYVHVCAKLLLLHTILHKLSSLPIFSVRLTAGTKRETKLE